MPVLTHLAEHLAPLVGAEFVVERNGVFVVSPKDTHEVAAVVAFADHHGLKVRPVGGRTKLTWGVAAEPQIDLSLQRLNRVIDHPWQDLTCTVQAGCTWEKLQQALGQHGQFVALDPLWPSTATVGGICATNDSGVLRHRYGSLRDMVLGMTIVLADGTIARTGGRVVKNVAGYDLPKLMVGSLGTLAVITEVTFRLYALPRYTQSFTVTADVTAKLASLMQAILDSHLATQLLQLRGDQSGFSLDIQLNAHPEAKQGEILQQLVASYGLELQREASSSLPKEHLWNDGRLVLKGTSQPDNVAPFVQEIVEKGGTCVAQSVGTLLASFPTDETSVRLAEEYRYHVDLQNGFTTVLSSHTELEKIVGAANTATLMNAIKYQFDPNQTLNPLASASAAQPVR